MRDIVLGERLGSVRFTIERSKAFELARAFGDRDPVWHDPEVARKAGFEGVPVPPTATVLADHWREHGALAHAFALGMDLKRLLHGEASWEFNRSLRVGDDLTATTEVAAVDTRAGRRGGTMTLVTLETQFIDSRGEPVARRRDVLIETGPVT